MKWRRAWRPGIDGSKRLTSRVRAGGSLCLGGMHRPILRADFWDTNLLGVTLDWGDQHGDPVWSLFVELDLPEPVADRIGRALGRIDKWKRRRRGRAEA